MRRFIAVLALVGAVLFVGWRFQAKLPPTAGDLEGQPCSATQFVVGELVADPTRGLAIRDDRDVVWPLLLGRFETERWSNWLISDEVAIVDAHGTVLATTGRRYKIGGEPAIWDEDRFFTCPEIFIPQ